MNDHVLTRSAKGWERTHSMLVKSYERFGLKTIFGNKNKNFKNFFTSVTPKLNIWYSSNFYFCYSYYLLFVILLLLLHYWYFSRYNVRHWKQFLLKVYTTFQNTLSTRFEIFLKDQCQVQNWLLNHPVLRYELFNTKK